MNGDKKLKNIGEILPIEVRIPRGG